MQTEVDLAMQAYLACSTPAKAIVAKQIQVSMEAKSIILLERIYRLGIESEEIKKEVEEVLFPSTSKD
jgi:hypothetical protein